MSLNMKKKKVLEISGYPPPRLGWGIRVAYVKNKLLEMGHECQVLNVGRSRKIKSKEYIDVQNGLDYIWKIFKYCLKGYRIHIHVNGKSHKGLILTLIAEVISLLLGKKCFLTLHAGINQDYFPKQNKPWFYIPIFYTIFSLPRFIICNHVVVKEKIMGYRIRGDKIVPIPAFSQQYLEYNKVDLYLALKKFLKNHRPILSSYVLLRPTFCIDATIKAFNTLKEKRPDIGLIFIGSNTKAEDMDATKIINLIKDLNLENSIIWPGDLTHDEFLTILNLSHIFVRSYIDDGVCSSVLEALSLNVPVVATKNSMRPDGIITFKAGDAKDLAKKIGYALDNYEKIKAISPLPTIQDTVSEEAALLIS